MQRTPTAQEQAIEPTHEFLSSTGEWYKCHVVRAHLILVTDPTYPLNGVSKYVRLGPQGIASPRLRRI